MQRAKDAGIKIIAYDRLLQNTDIDLYISFDNERVGTMMGEALLENGLAGGNVLMLGGSAVDSNVAMVEKGFRKVMEDNQVTILDSMHADGWKAELAGHISMSIWMLYRRQMPLCAAMMIWQAKWYML